MHPTASPRISHLERVKWLLEGVVESRSEKGRQYRPRVLLEANFLCTCNGSIMRDSICVHLQKLLRSMTAEELVEWIMDAQVIPKEISADV